jgi:dTDP-4-amino-4,6-dideoxygalactose transaminase
VKIPLVDLRASIEPIREEVLAAFATVLDGMELLLGENVQAFEREFAAFCEVPGAVGVSSGTDALYAALRACEVGAGDEVVVPALTFFATIEAVIHAGATPVMVDVDPETLTLDPGAVRDAISDRTRAIVPVHLYGVPVEMGPILALAAERGLRVVEDAAQAHGARDAGRRCGSYGDAAAFSFYFTKNLGALGEAGIVTSGDAEICKRIRLLRHHGHSSKFRHELVGHNLRLDELQAAVLRIKLRRLDEAVARRRMLARRYDAHFQGSPVALLRPRAHCEPAYHLYPIRVEQRDELIAYLKEQDIETGIHYRVPGHHQPALRDREHRCGPLPVTEEACRTLVSLPLYPELREDQLDFVAEHVLEFLRRPAPPRSSA